MGAAFRPELRRFSQPWSVLSGIDMPRASRANLAELRITEQPRQSAATPTVPAPDKPVPRAEQPSAAVSLHPAGERGMTLHESNSHSEIPPPRSTRIAIKSKGKILLLNPVDILAVEAEGNYVSLAHRAESHLLRESISTMAEKLKPYGFVRIHRSVLVNASCVEEISPGPTGEYLLRLSGGKQYVVSRTYKQNLKSLAHSWIGLDSFVED